MRACNEESLVAAAQAAAEWLNTKQRPLIVVGRRARCARARRRRARRVASQLRQRRAGFSSCAWLSAARSGSRLIASRDWGVSDSTRHRLQHLRHPLPHANAPSHNASTYAHTHSHSHTTHTRRHYKQELLQFAEATGYAVTAVADGKSFFPEDHPQFIGGCRTRNPVPKQGVALAWQGLALLWHGGSAVTNTVRHTFLYCMERDASNSDVPATYKYKCV